MKFWICHLLTIPLSHLGSVTLKEAGIVHFLVRAVVMEIARFLSDFPRFVRMIGYLTQSQHNGAYCDMEGRSLPSKARSIV